MTAGEHMDPEEIFNRAMDFHDAGRTGEAEALCRTILELDAVHGGALFYLGATAHASGRYDAAAELLARLVADQPDDSEALYLLAISELELGSTAAAIEHLQQTLALEPSAPAHYHLGESLFRADRIDEAVAQFQAALALDAGNADAFSGLGRALQAQFRFDEAAASYRQALAIEPNKPAALANLGQILHKQGRFDEGIAAYRQVLALQPDADTHTNLGSLLYAQNRIDKAIDCYRAALALEPGAATALNNLGVALCDLGRLPEAIACYRRAIAARFDYAEAHRNLGAALKDRGELEAAVTSLQQALDLKPDYVEAYSDYLMTLQYLPNVSRERLFEEHARFGEIFEEPLRTSLQPHERRAEPHRHLQIGFVSADFHMHPVGFFLESVLRHIDRENLAITLYSNNEKSDALTERLRAMNVAWTMLVDVDDDAAAQRIRDDAIDILVDLSGHSGENRLRVFARKPAPIQVTWLGYWATTGLRAMDYILCDRHGLPEDEQRYFVEQPWYLPHTRLCFTAPTDDIEVDALPALRNGYITFGCFNNLSKMTDAVVAVWARILREVAGSRLFLKSKWLADDAARSEVLARFAAHGIDAGRLLLEGASPRAQYFAAYQRVDIALDPFPFTGGTTSIEGLWMGVPVLTLHGDCMIAHQGEAILQNVGLADWIAADTDAYVQQAVARTTDLPALAQLRGELRKRLLTSPLCDGPGFARNLENAFREMWKLYVER